MRIRPGERLVAADRDVMVPSGGEGIQRHDSRIGANRPADPTAIGSRPTPTDLRESGDLENTADSVIGLYRDELEYPDTPERGLAELIVLKKRQLGDDVGTVRRIVWVGESYRDFAAA
jgi:replicative DNA helicase